jgi:hypothetical protein
MGVTNVIHIFVIVSVWGFLLRSDLRYETEDGMFI